MRRRDLVIDNFFSSTTQNMCLFSCCRRENMINDVLLFLFSRACCIFTRSRPQNLQLCRCHGIFYRRNTIKQCEEFNCTERSEACQKEIEHRCCNFLFNSSSFDFQSKQSLFNEGALLWRKRGR